MEALKYQGMLPIAKSTNSQKDLKTRYAYLKTRYAKNELTRKDNSRGGGESEAGSKTRYATSSRGGGGIETSSRARYAASSKISGGSGTGSKTRYANRELEIKDSANKEQNLQDKQLILSKIDSVGRKQKQEMAFEPRQKKLDFGGLLGWSLPGHGEPYHDCGETLVFGCLDVEAHSQACLDKDVIGKVFLDLRKRACLRAICPICYEKWAGKEAHKIEYRLSQWRSSGKAIHLMISVPRNLWHIPLEDLRPKIYKVARRVGFFGGSCIVHPFRQRCDYCGSPKDTFTESCLNCGHSHFKWVFSPHFHLIGFGWIRGNRVKEQYEKSGWITKNLGIRSSVFSTAHYQLSHCGIKEGKHSVTWFGRLAYNKLKVVPEIVEKRTCPLCGADLVSLLWVGGGLCPYEAEGEYYDIPANWVGSLGWRGGASFIG